MFRSFRHKGRESERAQNPKESDRLPLRWAVILLTSSIASIAVASVVGLPAAIGTWVAVAIALDRMLA